MGGGQAVKYGELAINREKLERLIPCAICFLLAAVLFGAQLFGGYAPFALGLIAAAGSGRRGLSALLGGVLGALAFMSFSHALRALAVAVLLYTGNNAFCETKWYRSRFFLPVLTASMYLAVEFVYLLQSRSEDAALCALSIALATLSAVCCRAVLPGTEVSEERRQAALLMLTAGVLMAASSMQFDNGLAPGRIPAMLLVMLLAYDRSTAAALSTALGIGLAMDLSAQPGQFLHTAVYSICALTMGPERRGRRVGAALLWCTPLVLLTLPLPAEEGLILLYEGLSAALIFLLLPSRVFGGKRLAVRTESASETDEAERSAVRRQLDETALALRELYDSLVRTPKPAEENPAMIFDRAAERVCRGCSLRTVCWEKDYSKTYNALNDATAALLAQGRGKGADFPAYFSDRCIRFPSFLSAVNAELSAFLLRRQYRGQLSDTRAQAVGQYAQLSELLSETAETFRARPASAGALLTYRIGMALRPKEGESISGDSMTHFETSDARLCLLLSDGMGSGAEARRESALAVRLLERFLRAGVEAPGALKTLNSALSLRAEVSESFTTIDLLLLSLHSGMADIYKYGAAPSYVKRGGRVRRITCSCLPAGLQSPDTRPETTRLHLEAGTFFIMLTDGVADVNDDDWLQSLLAGWRGDDPQALVSAILAAGREHRGLSDDGGVMALYIDENSAADEV